MVRESVNKVPSENQCNGAAVTSPKSISAVVACYKDAEAIPQMYERCSSVFLELGIDYEIIFVNDGSPDKSWEIIRAIASEDKRVVGVSHSRNFGSQFAFLSGLRVSSKDCAVLMDGDLQDPPEVIPKMLVRFAEGYDVVYGVRIRREMTALRNLLYRLFYRVYAKFSDFSIPRDAGDFAVLSRRVIKHVLQFRERELFLRTLRAYVGFRQTGVEYFRPERPFGVSTNSFSRNLDWARSAIFSSSTKPLKILTNLGLAILAGSLLLSVGLITYRFLVPENSVQGITFISLLILLFGGLNIFGIGLIGEYLGKVLSEVKARPAPIVESMIREGRLEFEQDS